MTDIDALQLHDRAARGEVLTEGENARLEAWYALQDAAEEREIASNSESVDIPQRIRASLKEVSDTALRIRRAMAENEGMRREVSGLRLKLAQQTARPG